MNDRAKAISVLREARDRLATRLTEHILESSEEILEDADGLRYVGGIEEVYDRLGTRLNHVSAMLQSLPPADEGPVQWQTAQMSDSDDVPPTSVMDTNEPIAKPTGRGYPALPAPQSIQQLTAPAQPISFRTFGLQIQMGDLDGAGRSISELFSLSAERGRSCAQFFAHKLAANSNLVSQAMSIRHELAGGSMNAAMMLLYECFGLQGPESVGVVQTLKSRFIE